MSDAKRPPMAGAIVAVASLVAIVLIVLVWRAVDSDDGNDAGAANEVQLTGARLEGLFVSLEEPADEELTVWLEEAGSPDATPEQAGVISAGQRTLADPDLGLGTLLDRFNRVVVGTDVLEYAFATDRITDDRVAEVRRLLIAADDLPRGESLLANATEQIGIFTEQARVLSDAVAEDDLEGVRTSAEIVVALSEGDADGIGLRGTADGPGYLPQIAGATRERPIAGLDDLQDAVARASAAAEACSGAGSIDDATSCATLSLEIADEVDALWASVPAAVETSVVLPLERR